MATRPGLISFEFQVVKDNILWGGTLAVAVLLLGNFLLGARQRERQQLPPGPWAWPVVGNLFNLGPWSYRLLREMALKHGDLMYLRMGSIPYIVISSSAMAKEVVTKHDLEFAYRPTRLFSSILCKSKDIAATSYSPIWRHLRMICTSQFFTKKRMSMYAAGRAEEIHMLIKLILRKSTSSCDQGSVVDLSFQLRNTTTNIISRMLFNKRYVHCH